MRKISAESLPVTQNSSGRASLPFNWNIEDGVRVMSVKKRQSHWNVCDKPLTDKLSNSVNSDTHLFTYKNHINIFEPHDS